MAKHKWVLIVACLLSCSILSSGLLLCSRFEAVAEDWTVISGNYTKQFPSMPKIALEVRCDLTVGVCSPLGKGSVLLVDDEEKNKYYPEKPARDFSAVYTHRQITHYDMFSYWVAVVSQDFSELLRVDASVWFTEAPFEPERQVLPSNLQMVEQAVTAVLHFSYEKRGEEPVIAVANLNLNRLSDCLSNTTWWKPLMHVPVEEEARMLLDIDQPADGKAESNPDPDFRIHQGLSAYNSTKEEPVCEIGYYGPTCGCTVVPRIRCVEDLGQDNDGVYRYRSHFAWNFACLPKAEPPEKILVSVDTLNWFWPGAEDRGQPTVFNSSKQGEEFTVEWSGEVLYWTLGITSTENQFHRMCKPAKPKPDRASIALSPRELREWYKEIFIDRVTWLTVSTNHTSEFFSPPDSSLAFFLDNQDVPCSNFDVIIESATPFCARVEREGLVATKKKSERCTEQPNEAGMYSRTFLYDLSRLPWMPDW
jgi:hypothetical protein